MRRTLTSSATPTITWRCPGCHRPERFASSDRFRANANGKLVDIWLIYRCCRCAATKNITVVERTPVRRIEPALLRAAEANDAAVARRLSRDVDLLRRNGASVASGDAWELGPPEPQRSPGNGLELVVPEPLLVRLHAVVAAATGRSPRAFGPAALGLPPGAPRPDALRLWSSVSLTLAPL